MRTADFPEDSFQSHERRGWRLSDKALLLVDEWLDWFIAGGTPQGELAAFRELIATYEAAAQCRLN